MAVGSAGVGVGVGVGVDLGVVVGARVYVDFGTVGVTTISMGVAEGLGLRFGSPVGVGKGAMVGSV